MTHCTGLLNEEITVFQSSNIFPRISYVKALKVLREKFKTTGSVEFGKNVAITSAIDKPKYWIGHGIVYVLA